MSTVMSADVVRTIDDGRERVLYCVTLSITMFVIALCLVNEKVKPRTTKSNQYY
jgi:hypothetical protein